MNVCKIWDQSPHNAFTDLIRYRGRWLCVFREGSNHVSDRGTLRLIGSDDGEKWQPLSQLLAAEGDLRDGKFSITAQGVLMLNAAVVRTTTRGRQVQSLSYFSADGMQWQGPHEIGDPGFWLWRSEWHKTAAYSIAYTIGKDRFARLYRSDDGSHFTTLVDDLQVENGPSEFALLFRDDDTALCLLRRDNMNGRGGDNGLLGLAQPPYTEWSWHDIGCRIGGPEMIELSDGRVVAAVRKYHFNSIGTCDAEWLELCWLHEENGTLETIMKLPSGGDCGYAGMVWHEGRLWISYYSSHEARASIYLAKVELP